MTQLVATEWLSVRPGPLTTRSRSLSSKDIVWGPDLHAWGGWEGGGATFLSAWQPLLMLGFDPPSHRPDVRQALLL